MATRRPHPAGHGGLDGTLRLWDPFAGKQHGEALTGHTASVLGVSPPGTEPETPTLLITTGYDRTVRVWDPLVGKQVRPRLPGTPGACGTPARAGLNLTGLAWPLSADRVDRRRRDGTDLGPQHGPRGRRAADGISRHGLCDHGSAGTADCLILAATGACSHGVASRPRRPGSGPASGHGGYRAR